MPLPLRLLYITRLMGPSYMHRDFTLVSGTRRVRETVGTESQQVCYISLRHRFVYRVSIGHQALHSTILPIDKAGFTAKFKQPPGLRRPSTPSAAFRE